MILHNLRSAWRTVRQNKFYSLINVSCLAIGIAVTMTVLLYVLHEHSYDRWHAKSRRIFAVTDVVRFGASTFPSYRFSYLTGPMALQTDPAVESMVRTYPAFVGLDLQNPASPETRFREGARFLFADSNFFSVFSFRLIRGQAATVLARPFTVVLTEAMAKKYFGTADPIGKTLVMDDVYRLEVTGIAADPPSNTSMVFDFIGSLSTMRGVEKLKPYLADQQAHEGAFSTWLLLRDISAVPAVERGLARLSMRTEAKELMRTEGSGPEDTHKYGLVPVGELHLRGYDAASRREFLTVFIAVAGLILLLALVNYMSLSTARSAARAKEVGVRKVMGAGRWSLAKQFYIESALYALLSFLVGGVLFLLFRSYFFHLIDLPIDGSFLGNAVVIGSFVGLLVLVILVSGAYPALVLSGFRPVAVLYGKMSRQLGGERVRKGFIVLQFSISMALVTGSFVIGKQLYYIRHVDTGINREHVVMLPFGSTMEHYGAYKQAVAALPAVEQAATGFSKLFNGSVVQLVSMPGKDPIQLYGMTADRALIRLLGIKWKEEPRDNGWFDREHVVLNESAVRAFDLGANAMGKQIKVQGQMVMVAGVVRNFNFWSLRRGVEPYSLTITADVAKEWPTGIAGTLYIKLGAHANIPTAMDAVRKIYTQFDNRTPFEFQFLDEAFDRNYKMDDRLAGVVRLFSVITIVIACLGLFALATFSAQQRLREIGIRKVLGASVGSIGVLLSRDFLRPVVLAVIIACPVAWWVMSKWLEEFAYRTVLSWWIFAGAGLGLLLVALGTVLVRSLRAGRMNPVENLRSE